MKVRTISCPRCGLNAVEETFKMEQEVTCFHCAYHYTFNMNTEIGIETLGKGVVHIVKDEREGVEQAYLCLTDQELTARIASYYLDDLPTSDKAFVTKFENEGVQLQDL